MILMQDKTRLSSADGCLNTLLPLASFIHITSLTICGWTDRPLKYWSVPDLMTRSSCSAPSSPTALSFQILLQQHLRHHVTSHYHSHLSRPSNHHARNQHPRRYPKRSRSHLDKARRIQARSWSSGLHPWRHQEHESPSFHYAPYSSTVAKEPKYGTLRGFDHWFERFCFESSFEKVVGRWDVYGWWRMMDGSERGIGLFFARGFRGGGSDVVSSIVWDDSLLIW